MLADRGHTATTAASEAEAGPRQRTGASVPPRIAATVPPLGSQSGSPQRLQEEASPSQLSAEQQLLAQFAERPAVGPSDPGAGHSPGSLKGVGAEADSETPASKGPEGASVHIVADGRVQHPTGDAVGGLKAVGTSQGEQKLHAERGGRAHGHHAEQFHQLLSDFLVRSLLCHQCCFALLSCGVQWFLTEKSSGVYDCSHGAAIQ